jgi:hypothetical protein
LDHETVTQTISTGTISPPDVARIPDKNKKSNAELAALWNEARLVYPIYAALVAQFSLAPLPYPPGQLPPLRPTRSAFDRDLQWLDQIDGHLLAYQLRQISSEVLNGNEPSLRAFIQRHLKKPDKTVVDRDKLDWLIVQYFALCAPEGLYREEIRLEDVAKVLQPIFSAAVQSSDCSRPLENILVQLESCDTLRDITENGIVEQGRMVKDAAGSSFYAPASLVAFCRFNFLLRRAFIRVLHNDLKTMGEAIDTLEARGKKTIDCRRAGFSAAETTSQLRHFCANWKQPFQKDYTESSVSRSLEQFQALRADLEDALQPSHQVQPQPLAPLQALVTSPTKESSAASPAEGATSPRFNWGRLWGRRTAPPADSQKPKDASEDPATHGQLDADSCCKRISEQLAGSPTSASNAMATVTLKDTKFLLSSWEVNAFVAEAGQKSEDLRRAVVARALLAVAVDQRKHSGEESQLASALAFARTEKLYLQGRVENAKRTNNTESAVNLGISTKRLVSSIEEAEKFQP